MTLNLDRVFTTLSSFNLVFLVISSTANNVEPTIINAKIVGGRPANRNEFPYMVSIRRTEFEELFGYGNHVCGGTIVDSMTVITAAHCMFDTYDNFLGNPNSFTIVAGANVLKPKQLNSQMRKVTNIYVHPGYSPETLENDIAVLKMKNPFRLNGKNIDSIGLQHDELEIGTQCSIHGWGFQSYNSGVLSNNLLTTNIPIYNHTECEMVYEAVDIDIFNTTLCAGIPSGERDSCNGDSGGPLICNKTLTGIVSFGNECAMPNFPGVYTKILDYIDYIDDPASFNGTFVTHCTASIASNKTFSLSKVSILSIFYVFLNILFCMHPRTIKL